MLQDSPGMNPFIESFRQECKYLNDIKHPNIVQYLGICQKPQNHHPALLMELMDQSLRHFLESSSHPLATRVETNICHDTALALAHLHSIGIIHRDLSSNNVLLIGNGIRAKICDFGMSKMVDASRSRYITPLSLLPHCPGVVSYMPPQALWEVPIYTAKLDCFSFGVLSIEIMTGLLPNPTARTKIVDYDCLTGKIPIPVLETECRKEHIDMIDQGHPLLPIALRCLAMKEEGRPSARELCELLEEVKLTLVDAITAPDDCQVSDPVEATKLKTGEKACRCGELEAIRQDQEHKVASLHRQLQVSEATNAKLNRIKLNQEKKIERLLQQLKEKSGARKFENPLQAKEIRHKISTGILVQDWRVGKDAPYTVAQKSSAVEKNCMYCAFNPTPVHVIFYYDIKDNSWSKVPCFETNKFTGLSLFVKNGGLLVTFRHSLGDSLYMLDGKWHKAGKYNLIHSSRITCVSYHNDYLLLFCFDYFDENNKLLIFELTGGTHYGTIKNVPIFDRASAIVCGDKLYLVEIGSKGKWTKKTIRTSLSKLFHKQSFLGFKTDTAVEWEKMAPLPVVRSTCVSYRNHLLSVGGYEEEEVCNKIFAYDEAQSSWDIIGSIPTARYNCLVNVVRDQLVVVGGWINHMECCDIVEIGTLHIYN